MKTRSNRISFQFIDVFSEVSSNGGLTLDDFNIDAFEKSLNFQKSPQTNRIIGADEHLYENLSLEDEKISLEPIFNSQLKIQEKHTDLEVLKPEGIGATKFNTSILKNKKEKKSNNGNKAIQTKLKTEASSLNDEFIKNTSTLIGSSGKTLNSNFHSKKLSFIAGNSKVDSSHTSSKIKSKFISNPNITNTNNIQLHNLNNNPFNYAYPQYHSNTAIPIIARPFPQPIYSNYPVSYVPLSLYNIYCYQPSAYNGINIPSIPTNISQQLVNLSNNSTTTTLQINKSLQSHAPQINNSFKNNHEIPNTAFANKCTYKNHDEYLISYLNNLHQSEDLINYICNQSGCKEVQRKLHKMGTETANHILKMMINLDGLEKVMKNSFANYIFQKSSELASPHMRVLVLKKLESRIINIGCDVFGSHCLQKLVIIMNTDTEKSALLELISKVAIVLSYDSYGVYIIIKLLEVINEEDRVNFNSILLQILGDLVKDIQGVCVVS